MEEPNTLPVLVHPATEKQHLPVFLLAFVGVVFGYAMSCVLGGPIADEGFHGPQIWHYYRGGTEHLASITMPSTYHYIIAFVVRNLGYYHDYLLRFISMTVAICFLPVFYRMAKRYYPENAGIRTLQLLFAPLVFPYFFLIFTDIWALLMIALCFYFSLGRRYLLAGVFGFCAIGIRQDSVIWVGLAYLLICFDGVTLTRPLPYKQALRNIFVRGLPLALVFVVFIAFVIYNGGVAIGDADSHQIHNMNVSNLWIFLICGWFLFLALCIQQLPRIVAALKRPWVVALVVGGFLLYMATLSNPHSYNRILYHYFLHNGLMYILMEYTVVRALMYIPIAWMALTLCVMKYPDKRCYWMLLIIPIAVISHPLIEPRYYFPAYVLINMWRPAMNMVAETTTLVVYVILAAFIMFGSVTGMFFL